MQDNKSLPTGTILNGKYRIEKTLGAGGFGITYLCRHVQTGSPYAVKEHFLRDQCSRDMRTGQVVVEKNSSYEQYEAFRKKFVNEAQTLSQLNHPNIVRILELFHENGTSYFVMPLVEGRSFKDIIEENRGPLNYDVVINYIAQLTEAVGYIHEKGMLHRDIKPDNMMITPQHRVMLIDFGAARSFVQDQIGGHTVILTPGYAPLEQYDKVSPRGAYSDIYSIGAVLYHALTQIVPDDARGRTYNDPVRAPKLINPAIPEAANRTIIKAMSVKSADRYQRIEEFWSDLLDKGVGGGGSTGGTAIPKVVTIGRNPNNDKVINDSYVGRHHCQIIQETNGSIRLIDLNSTNGTFVNEQQIYGEVKLRSNDTVRIGNTILPWQNYFVAVSTNPISAGTNKGSGTTTKPFWRTIFNA